MGNNSMDKIKEFFGFGTVDSYQNDYEDDRFREERHYPSYRSDVREDRYGSRHSSYSSYYAALSPRSRYGGSGASRVDDIPARRSQPVQPAQPSYTAMTLGSYTQAGDLAAELKKGDIVAFSLSGLEKSEARRVLDFAAGLARGLDAKLEKLKGVRNFVLIPNGVTLEQDQLDAVADDL